MIGYSFIFIEPIGELKGGILILLGMLLILVLAESFDSFSLGKLISISRAYEAEKVENKSLERRNAELINQLVSFSNSQNQRQQNTNVYGDYYSEEPKNSQSEKPTTIGNVKELLDRIGTSRVITDLESKIREELQNRGLNVKDDAAVVLLRHLAGTQLLLEFERIHSVIFGSQIFLLKELNKLPDGISEAEVFAHFLNVKNRFPETFKEWNGDQYLAFLYGRYLIVKNPDNNVRITELGNEYLTWITRNGLREDKIY